MNTYPYNGQYGGEGYYDECSIRVSFTIITIHYESNPMRFCYSLGLRELEELVIQFSVECNFLVLVQLIELKFIIAGRCGSFTTVHKSWWNYIVSIIVEILIY
jgi:hypothetical protein